MSTARRLTAAVVVLVAAACSAPGPQAVTYTFNPNSSPVKVDTPQLRALKAETHIQPCPVSGVGTEGMPGGLPDITLPCLGGGHSVDLASLRGPLVLNFWAQTCGPCRQESPVLQEFATVAAGKVAVMGVDFYDPRPSLAIGFAEQLGLTYPQIADPEAATKAALHISAIPVTVFVSASGRVSFTELGPITSLARLEQLVKQHLGVSVPSGSDP